MLIKSEIGCCFYPVFRQMLLMASGGIFKPVVK